MVVPVPLVRRVPVPVVEIVDVVAVPDRGMSAVRAVLVVVPGVGDVSLGLALVPVAGVLPVQMPVVRVVDVVAVLDDGVPAGRAVAVLVSGVFLVNGGHGAHLQGVRASGWEHSQASHMTGVIGML
ncbi:hypothetical protein GCM10010365_27660 [Streptomyces poonensis]|uniref:Uncharacterized protein n=1 Tax=Streptomyces poonensis TaxID=68255 RepID=A0A918PH03_9ACTN|nr:hypothetical protein GCM10010365_27660 [Streptomyces poonensis]GLJ88606.1 hypothetical protein GCM10017589_12060 [Streptomyces poonensis]